MPGWCNGRLEWSAMLAVVLPGVAGVALLGLLALAWQFELASSPGWQVGIFHLASLLLLSTMFVLASRRPFGFSVGFRGFTLALALVVPASVLVWSWLAGGLYEGLRDDRIFYDAVVSVAAFMLVWVGTIFPYTVFVFGMALWRCRREGVPYRGGVVRCTSGSLHG